MKKLLVIVAILAIPFAANAAVDGGAHDMVTWGDLVGDQGTLQAQLCMSCHLPHLAQGAAGNGANVLWAIDESADGTYTGIKQLCYTCHDGSIATPDAPYTATIDHKGDVNCSGATTSCHDVHTQNPNGSGKFLTVTATNGSYCESCHGGTPAAGLTNTADHTVANKNHYLNGSTFNCLSCHANVHGVAGGAGPAVAQSAPGSDTDLLPVDNWAGGTGDDFGKVCEDCHENAAGVYNGDHGAIGGGTYTSYNNDAYASKTQHPTSGKTLTGTYSAMTGCNTCHFVHDDSSAPTVANSNILWVDNKDSDYCQTCHLATDASQAPIIGGGSHPVDEVIAAQPDINDPATNLPWANAIDDDGATLDYAGATKSIVCETCHSVHRKGVVEPFLRVTNANNKICTDCHASH